ncbi:MAG: hypothetical protein KatS3mg019_0542 [Fimbriimonadales bacterium]|nr:MAG: hypothetical protein KatS3mg019_0542 [Fimbriimonadales bacterium]
MNKLLGILGIVWIAGIISASAQQGGNFDLTWWTIDSGGATFVSGGDFTLGATVGQHDAAEDSFGGPFRLISGFWYPPCLVAYRGDVTGNHCVDDEDLLLILFNFGAVGNNIADVNCDGIVDDADLLIVLFNFGFGCS